MTRPDVVVYDYGSGNLRSAQRAVQRAGARVTVTADAATAERADGLVVPGVGAFAACIAGIEAIGADAVIARRVASGAPVLGICVGAQVLFDSGEEHGVVSKGLGVFAGSVSILAADRVPHMGWNTVTTQPGMTLFDGLPADARFYFVHSYAVKPPVPDSRVAVCDHGEPFVAAIERGAVAATQFHPEKSGDAGAVLLSNWIKGLK